MVHAHSHATHRANLAQTAARLTTNRQIADVAAGLSSGELARSQYRSQYNGPKRAGVALALTRESHARRRSPGADVSGLIHPCARHRGKSADVFDRDEFLGRVGDHLVVSAQEAERITRAVFGAVRMWLPARDVRKVAVQLPDDLQDLWRSVAQG